MDTTMLMRIVADVLAEIDITEMPHGVNGMMSGMDPISSLQNAATSMFAVAQDGQLGGADLATITSILEEIVSP